MFLVALGAHGLASWDRAELRKRVCEITVMFRRRQHYEYDARIENAIPDFYRQMDPQGLVFAEGETSSTRGVAQTPRKRLPTDAYQNSSQPRIHRIDREARDEIEGHRGRVFLDTTGKDDHRSTPRYVPLGKTIPPGYECRRAPYGTLLDALSEVDIWLCICVLNLEGERKGERYEYYE